MGIVISEISELFFRKAIGRVKPQINEWRKENEDSKKGFKKSKDEMESVGITAEELAAALYQSGKKSSKSGIVQNIKTNGWEAYMQYMYGAIQSNEKYKRIHNYSSMRVLCKNMAMALAMGMCILYYCGFRSKPFTVAVVVSIAALILRFVRFDKKKNEYTIVWFVNQFCPEEDGV